MSFVAHQAVSECHGSILNPNGMTCSVCGQHMPCVAPLTDKQQCTPCLKRRHATVSRLTEMYRRATVYYIHGDGAALNLHGVALDEAIMARAIEHGDVHLGADVDRLIRMHTGADKALIEQQKTRIADLYAENRRILAEAFRSAGRAIRAWCNDRTVPSRYRREGVMIAADKLDPPAPTT